MFCSLNFFIYFFLLFHFLPTIAGIKIVGKGGRQELLLKNITQILDLLLENYDNSQHPNYRYGRPTLVHTNMMIRSMGPVSELDMYWRDPRLSFRGPVESLSLSIKMLERLWRPDTFFRNGRHSYVHTITVPNKLLRLTQEVAYPSRHIIYSWDESGVSFVPGMTLSQFDLGKTPFTSLNLTTKEGEFSVLQVNFELVRHAGFFLIHVYVPCILIVILSWVSFWINRESTSDRVNLGITAFLTLSTISLDARTDLPKVHYATALDWFILMSFGYCMASILEFAGVHINSSGEKLSENDEEDEGDEGRGLGWEESRAEGNEMTRNRIAACLNSPTIYNNARSYWQNPVVEISETPSRSVETQTVKKASCFRQFLRCVAADEKFKRQRQQSASGGKLTNSVSKIDQVSRILFPVSFFILNIFYWVRYAYFHDRCERMGG